MAKEYINVRFQNAIFPFIFIGGLVCIAFLISALLVGVGVAYNKAYDHYYPNAARDAVAEMSRLDKEWVEQDKKDMSYIHICGRKPCQYK